ncbi:GNAT family N-acetyltransferase [Williamsia deligens]|uniref:GNAT family N-acetyltransferase n=1 Tax=Williamsia deligens TaxID=321325 RepID=A0ABW3GCK1_9NOCA|nr:GNAT family N-acetyltransferase [Williamsia deligens]MCP2192499.1 aminoglycoside 6'-N-acetyltransferase [Williamsia deligens]
MTDHQGVSASQRDRAPLDAITFRPLTRDDFPMLAAWLAEPRVHRWWFQDADEAALERDFGPQVDGTEPGEDLVVEVTDDGGVRPVGLVQSSRIVDVPDDVAVLEPVVGDVPPTAWCLDYLIGAESDRGHGLGPRIIAAAVDETFARHPDATEILVPVVAANRASWRALEKAGFTVVATGDIPPDNPVDDPRHHVLRRTRAET